MGKTSTLACAACTNTSHCAECSTNMQSPIAFKVSLGKKSSYTAKASSASKVSFTRMPNITLSAPVKITSACTHCENKHCVACSMYNTQFVQY